MLTHLMSLHWSQLYLMAFTYIFGRGLLLFPLFFGLQAILERKRLITRAAPYSRKQIQAELLANIKVNLLDVILLPSLILTGGIRLREPDGAGLFLGFLITFLFFEIWFYAVHRVLHRPQLRWIHGTHHRFRRTSPLTALALSAPEKLLNITGMYLIPGLLTHLLPMAFEGILAYHLYNFVVNVLGHSNVEILPRGYESSPPGRVLSTSTYHSLHHLHGQKNFGLFSTILDRTFGTYAEGYPKAFRQITDSRPLDH